MEPILIYDTTLRDGTQGENITFTADEKLKIAMRLDDMGIHYIEGGMARIQSPGHPHFFDLAKRERSRRPGSRPSGPPAGPASLPPTTPT
jgi:2-isopropylmalate synthase